MNESVILDFEISQEQVHALNLHILFKQKRVYDNIDEDLDFDHVQVWFQVGYNDNWWDVDAVYFDLIKYGKIISKIKACTYNDIEIQQYDGDEGIMQSFTITKKML